MSAFVGVNDPSPMNGRNRAGSFASDPGSMSRSSSTTSLEELNNTLARFKAAFPGRTNEQKAKMASNARTAYQKHFKAAQNRWLSSHGMPKAVNKAELARLNKESRAYAKKIHGHQAAINAGLAGGKRRRNTRRNRKANRKNRRNTRRN